MGVKLGHLRTECWGEYLDLIQWKW